MHQMLGLYSINKISKKKIYKGKKNEQHETYYYGKIPGE